MHRSYCLLGLSLAALLAAAPASANEVAAARTVQRRNTPRSNLTSQCPGQCVKLSTSSAAPTAWQLEVTHLSRGQRDIVVWIQDVETRETLEQQSGLHVSFDRRLKAVAATDLVAGDHKAVIKHPMLCGHTYQAIVFDAGTGSYYYSNSLQAC